MLHGHWLEPGKCAEPITVVGGKDHDILRRIIAALPSCGLAVVGRLLFWLSGTFHNPVCLPGLSSIL